VEGENRLYTILALAGGFFSISAALFFGSAPAAAFAAACFLSAVALWKYGYAIMPLLLKRAGVVEVGRNFEIPPSQDVVVGKSGWNFLATAFLAARLYESASEKDEKGKAAMVEMFERAISSAGFPFKVCCLVCPLGLQDELEEARSRRSLAESKLAKLGSTSKHGSEQARLKREIAMWGRQIEKLTSGEMPLEVVFYLSTTGSGMTKEEAVSRANAQAEELSVVVGGALACEVARLRGEEMKRCFWWDFFGPTDRDDLEDEMF
jgi:hypothetical protein